VRLKGKIIQWNEEKAFGFIKAIDGDEHFFMHKTALANRKRVPKLGDSLTFSLDKDNQGRYCATAATFIGEKLKKKKIGSNRKFSVVLTMLFLATISLACILEHLPTYLLYAYWGLSTFTFWVYANDKIKAQRGSWRTKESTLHFLALLGGWPGAVFAQQFLRHKSQKHAFRNVFWLSILLNVSLFTWLNSSKLAAYLALLS
jgi:uncharacterized membrane protein YsdA (DUF1294 family)/cold shock CspA family protein